MSEKLPLSPEQERQLLDATITKIQGMIEECAQGVSDRETDALTLAEPFEQLRDWVTDGFARARPKKPDAEGRTWGVEPKRRKLTAEPEPETSPEEPEPELEPEPVKVEAKRSEPERTEALAPAVRSWAEVRVPVGANELEALTYVPGLVGDIVEWIVRGSRRPNRMMALGVAVTVVGTLIGRCVQGPTESATHLYAIILGPSGIGKDDPLKFGKALMDAVGASELIGPDEFASTPGLWKRLKRSPLLVCFVDEMGDELAKINMQGGNEWVSQLIGTLKKCYNSWEIVHTAEKAAEESERLVWVAISLVGAATPEKFFAGVRPGDIESGFVNRMLILPLESYKRAPEQARPAGADVPPPALVKALKRLPNQKVHTASLLDVPSGEVQRGAAARPTKLPPMPWGPGAEETYFAFSRRLDRLIETDPRRDELSRRGAENAIRIATNIARGRYSPSVDREDIELAIKLAERSIEAAAGGIEKYMREYLDFPKFCERLLAKIAEHDGFRSESALRRDFRNNQKTIFDFDSAIRQLTAEGRIQRASRRSGERGPIAEGWKAL